MAKNKKPETWANCSAGSQWTSTPSTHAKSTKTPDILHKTEDYCLFMGLSSLL